MSHDEGAFYSALDSDSGGSEGGYYTWSFDEVDAVLGRDDVAIFTDVYSLRPTGNWMDEATGRPVPTNILHRRRPLTEVALELGLDTTHLRMRLSEHRKTLLDVRSQRARPYLDDKVVSGWNGLMISTLAHSGVALKEPRYVRVAERAADFLLETMVEDDGTLLRTYRLGKARQFAHLSDYAFAAQGLLSLYKATNDVRWLTEAERMAKALINRFEDRENGGFYSTSRQHDDVIYRSKSLLESSGLPSGYATATELLLELSEAMDNGTYRQIAHSALAATTGFMHQFPSGSPSLVAATARFLDEEESQAEAERGASDRASGPDLKQQNHPVAVELFASMLTVRPGDELRLAIELNIAPGWHLYGDNGPDSSLIPAQVRVEIGEHHRQVDTQEPAPSLVLEPSLKKEIKVLEGRVWFVVDVEVSRNAPDGPLTLPVEIVYQSGDDRRCLAPQTTRLDLPLHVLDDATQTLRHAPVFESIRSNTTRD